MGKFVRLEIDDGVGLIRIDRPPANAIDLTVGLELVDAVRDAGDRDAVGAVVVWGGPTIFAAGADIKAMAEWSAEEVRPSVDALGDACDLLEDLDKPVIAAVNGFALGGGLELALACDLRYLGANAKVGQPEIQLGVIPGAGGTQRLTQLVGPGMARRLVYTGERLDATEAAAVGLAERVVTSGEVVEAAVTDARAFARGPRLALTAAKRAIRAAVRTPGPEGVRTERVLFLELFGTHDQREGMRAFLEKRDARFGGAAR
jgi:enoyl-CoA hydratase